MGFLDFLGKRAACPACGRPRAFSLFGKIKCANQDCRNFDRDYAEREAAGLAERRAASLRARPRTGNFDPGENAVEIRYTNYLGVDGAYTADRRTVRRKHEHITAQLVPTGKRVAFARTRIQNLSEVEQWIQPEPVRPTGRERQVLHFHKKRGSTSALYEMLKKKYPDYQ